MLAGAKKPESSVQQFECAAHVEARRDATATGWLQALQATTPPGFSHSHSLAWIFLPLSRAGWAGCAKGWLLAAGPSASGAGLSAGPLGLLGLQPRLAGAAAKGEAAEAAAAAEGIDELAAASVGIWGGGGWGVKTPFNKA